MRCILLLITILLTITLLPAPKVQTQQPTQDQFPKLEDYPRAGANCKSKWKLEPWLGMADVTTNTGRCELSVSNCKTGKTDRYKSRSRNNNPIDCTDYLVWKERLATIEICCDQDSSAVKCSPPTPWFDTSSGCKDVKSPQLTISGGTATLYVCGHPVFYYTIGHDDLLNEAYRQAMKDHLLQRGAAKLCCDKFNDAVRTGKPCDPRMDVDCDGQPTTSDRIIGYSHFPTIDASFTVPSGVSPDAFPIGLTADEIMPPDQCKDCKWELLKGVLNCNPDPAKRHSYDATWKCPSTGAVVEVTKLSKPGAPCQN